MTRSSENWTQPPGSFDALHATFLFPTDGNAYGIPSVPHTPLAYRLQALIPYRARLRDKGEAQHMAVHFFFDNYPFSTVWARPKNALQACSGYRTSLDPGVSLYS